VLWLNGTFGVGKSTTALHIVALDPSWHLFDPEWVGYMLRASLHGFDVSDFQDYPAWRTLVPRVAHEVASHTGSDLLAMQTVLHRDYWRQLRSGLSTLGLQTVHVVLDATDDALRARIAADTGDPGAAGWRLDHVATYAEAREWMVASADVVVDTTSMTPQDVAAAVLGQMP
jgi:hypothetical protein